MTGAGSIYLKRYREGQALTPKQSILAKCADCQADYADGRKDCGMEECHLYPWMPYGKIKRKAYTVSAEKKKKLVKALKKARKARWDTK